MERVDVWQETCTVRFGQVDCSNLMTLDAALKFFQEAAISHAENLGLGKADLARTGQGWILYRMSVWVERRPRYGETFSLRTWPRGGEKLLALRDFDIRCAGSDVPVIRARSGWIVLDLERRRPLRPQAVLSVMPLNEGLDALPTGTVELRERQGLQKAGERKALYTDVDANGHVNNARYVEWAEDITETALLTEAGQMRLDINYLKETLPGETVALWSGPVADDPANTAVLANPDGNGAPPKHSLAFEGRNTGSGQAAFRMELRLW